MGSGYKKAYNKGVMKRAACCQPRKRQLSTLTVDVDHIKVQPVLFKQSMSTKKSAVVDVDGNFHDQLYDKKYYFINLDKTNFFFIWSKLTRLLFSSLLASFDIFFTAFFITPYSNAKVSIKIQLDCIVFKGCVNVGNSHIHGHRVNINVGT